MGWFGRIIIGILAVIVILGLVMVIVGTKGFGAFDKTKDKITELNKRFVILSKGETAGAGMSKIYISEFVEQEPGVYSLIGIKDDHVWARVKDAMKQIVES